MGNVIAFSRPEAKALVALLPPISGTATCYNLTFPNGISDSELCRDLLISFRRSNDISGDRFVLPLYDAVEMIVAQRYESEDGDSFVLFIKHGDPVFEAVFEKAKVLVRKGKAKLELA